MTYEGVACYVWGSAVSAAGYRIERSPDGANWVQVGSSSTNSYSDTSLSSATQYYYRVRAYAPANNNSAYSNTTSALTNADTTPPTVSASPKGGAYTSAQSVNLAASEEASIYFTEDGTTPTAGSMQYIGLPINIVGTTTLKFMAVDTAGNQSQVYTENYIIDNSPPTVSFTSPSTDTTATADTTITASGTDNITLSKLDLTIQKYGTNDIQDLGAVTGSTSSLSNSWGISTSKLTDGEYILTLTGTDEAGNISTSKIKLNGTKYTYTKNQDGTYARPAGCYDIEGLGDGEGAIFMIDDIVKMNCDSVDERVLELLFT